MQCESPARERLRRGERQPVPIVPEEAHAEGTTRLMLTIDAEGYVQRVEVIESAGEALDQAALGAACGFVFEPAELDGVPVTTQLTFTQHFRVARREEEP